MSIIEELILYLLSNTEGIHPSEGPLNVLGEYEYYSVFGTHKTLGYFDFSIVARGSVLSYSISKETLKTKEF